MDKNPVLLPEFVKFNPLVGLKSFRTSSAGGAWRLMVLAKNLAGNLDHIERETLRQATRLLGVQDKTFRRWLDAARGLNFVSDIQRTSGEWMLILSSNNSIAFSLGCVNHCRVVQVPIENLFAKNWRAIVFAAWQAGFTGNGERLVSQKKQYEITGIQEQTQRQFNKAAGVQSQKNYAISNIHANGYGAVLEFGNRAGLFQYWNKETHQKHLGWRIPNSRYFPLFGTGGSYKTRRTMSLFNRTAVQYAASMKAIRKNGVKFSEMYVFDRTSQNGNNLWIHLPQK
ncbi:MAG TPA: hypothetical protein PLT08_11460 [Anaerolineales bacterium]|nr:hypothetical protein [Anaerolineales bacterium]